MQNGHPITEARRPDVAPLAEMLARSFVDDPGLVWMVPDESARRRCLPGFFRALLIGTMRHGLALHAPENDAATLWRLPGKIYPGTRETLTALPAMFPFLRHSGKRAQILGRAVRDHAPKQRFRYLQFAGVAPERQGRGLGGAAIRTGLQAAAKAGDHVYLETPKAANVSLYLHLGFEIISEWSVEGGPGFTSMLKAP